MEGTAALRAAAPRWSLAGDQQLLDLLQEIHQRIISRCNETNKRLEEMSRGLRNASVNLQNVNNKFLALSNTQFVESRVYEDDTDVTPAPAVDKEPPKVAELASGLTQLKRSLQILESYHEPLPIARDGGSDSDDDDGNSLVLQPIDLYSDRPLPYIIGSQAWRSKWHAGLVPEESDSDSSTSKVEDEEEYSESDDERREEPSYEPSRKISSGSSSLHSEAAVSVSPARPSPSAVAAELARRLGGDVTIPEREHAQPETIVRKLYKPQEPLATTIFPDEPPPLDDASSDDDIFAELLKTQPKASGNTVEDLFDFTPKPSLEEALFGPPKVQPNQTADKPPLFVESKPDVTEPPLAREQTDDGVKKPVGGISLFGTNNHAESIGAAILKRNRRKSSTSGDESNTEEAKVVKEVKPAKDVKEVKKERDIFDDLFAKSEKLNKKNAKNEPKEVVKPKEVKKDIFSDIFDDIDDIFSSDIVNVQIKETKKNEKSLFGDDDDLFAEISKVNKGSDNDKVTVVKSDLFSGVVTKAETSQNKEQAKSSLFINATTEKRDIKKEIKVIKDIKETKSLFDSDSDDGLFTNVSNDVKQNKNKSQSQKPVEYNLKDDLFDDDGDDDLFAKNNAKAKIAKNISKVEDSKPSSFDSDDELFKDAKNVENEVKPHSQSINVVKSIKDNGNDLFTTPVIKSSTNSDKSDVVETDSDELFKTKAVRNVPTVIDSINNDLFSDDVPLPESPNKSKLETNHDSFDDEEEISQSTTTKTETDTNITDTAKSSNNDVQHERTMQNDDMFSRPDKKIYFKENILRTTRIGADEDDTPISTETTERDIFNDSDDDLFRSKPTIPKTNDSHGIDTSKPTVEPKSPELFATPPAKNDIFSDIFDDVPPIFEKPKEPKKSKNVNALFDDDSDDEALFFKKNDVITDEKPDFIPSEERFGIFNDEPPAIDVDFTQKPSKSEDVIQNTHKTEDIPPALDKPDSLPPKSVKTESIIEKSDDSTDSITIKEAQDTTDNTSKEPKKIGKLKPMNFNINVNSLLPGASPTKKQAINPDGQTASNEELHKTDKIEPKMVKSISFDDPEILDNKISKERAKIQVKRRPSTRRARKEAVRKSAIDITDSSFDSSNENSSKEEVKEKIVKTVYILNDDDIFGSTKTNNDSAEHKKKHLNIVDSDEELFKTPAQKIANDYSVNTDENKHFQQATLERKSSLDSDDSDNLFKKSSNTIAAAKNEIYATDKKDNQKAKTVISSNENEDVTKNKNVEEIIQASDNKSKINKESPSFLDPDDSDDLFKRTNKPPALLNPINDPKFDSDEELFRNTPKTKNDDPSIKETSPFFNSDDDGDLFKTKTTKAVLKPNISSNEEDLFRNKGIGTLGNAYKSKDNTNAKEVNETHNIFDDFPAKSSTSDNFNQDITQGKPIITIKEQVIDKPKENVEKTAIKKSILDDLSDEDDLFKSKTKLVNKNDKSLFGDYGDDDDLFGSKSVKEVKPDVSVAQQIPTKETKTAEPVFVDPLSLFGDNE